MTFEIVVPSKRRVDVKDIRVDMTPFNPTEIPIVGVETRILVFSGVDPVPEDMLDGLPNFIGNVIYQRVRLGLPGVIYYLTFFVELSDGNVIEVDVKQAVLEDGVPPGPIYIPLYLTSKIYPLEAIDGILAGGNLLESHFFPTFNFTEGTGVSAHVLAGELRTLLIQYNGPPEGVDISGNLLAGELRTILHQYECPPEGTAMSANLLSGVLRTLLIQNSMLPEGMDMSATVLSGTLV